MRIFGKKGNRGHIKHKHESYSHFGLMEQIGFHYCILGSF
jgi:hypothetical protein